MAIFAATVLLHCFNNNNNNNRCTTVFCSLLFVDGRVVCDAGVAEGKEKWGQTHTHGERGSASL